MSECNQELCIICSEDLNINEIQYLQCFHKFHILCISKWIKIKPMCPVCKFPTNINIVGADEDGKFVSNRGDIINNGIIENKTYQRRFIDIFERFGNRTIQINIPSLDEEEKQINISSSDEEDESYSSGEEDNQNIFINPINNIEYNENEQQNNEQQNNEQQNNEQQNNEQQNNEQKLINDIYIQIDNLQHLENIEDEKHNNLELYPLLQNAFGSTNIDINNIGMDSFSEESSEEN
jgi:hypothetical protein